MLHLLIKEATKDLHDDLEQLMFAEAIMTGSLTYYQYKQIATINYLITAIYESKLSETIDTGVALRLTLQKRVKLAALRKDLAEINAEVTVLGKFADFGPEKEFALGGLYVLEGATLGGNIIVKKLKENIFLQPYRLNFHYYQVYGEQLIPFWKQFCEVINEQPEAHYPKIIEGAKFIYGEFIKLCESQTM